MALQVGTSCYATPVDAGVAACAAFVPVSSISADGTKFRTVSCSGADVSTGALHLVILSSDTTAGSVATTSEIQQQISYPECIQGQYVDASLTIFGACLAAFFICWGPYKVYQFITKNSRVPE